MDFRTQNILVVDLDGTLLCSDMLYESFWSAFGRDWRTPFLSAAALSNGRASLKRHLALTASIEVMALPFDSKVISYIKKWRNNGGRTALVTASDQTFAQDIADHLGIFDEAHGSNGSMNLKSERKGLFLEERFGKTGFAYMGDALADLPVWARATKAITVNAPATLQRKVERVSENIEHLTTIEKSFQSYVKALRPHQWLKNTLVFLPMLAAHHLTGAAFLFSLLAFISFSLVASSAYILNDLLDLSADRVHPHKRNRPFASGNIPIVHGMWIAAGLILLGTTIAVLIGWEFFLVMVGYFLLTTAYSINLKRRVVIDICMLAGFYTMRIVAGGVATTIPISVWLLSFSIFFFLSLASIKRQAELVDNVERGRLKTTGRGYRVDDLPIISMISVSAGYISVLILALYLNSPKVVELYANPKTMLGICAVLLYWITHSIIVAHRGQMHDDPLVYAVKDGISQACFLLILAFIFGGVVS